MSVNYTDFDKIWASTSPLTPYEFSESQYKEGWNFVGNTPPSRQMWDKFMQQADEKMQYLYNHESVPVGHEYFTFNPNIPQGSLPLFGGEYSRETYSALWNWVQEQTGYLKTEAEWQTLSTANNGNVPYYSDGDGSTTFRVPSLKCWVKGANGTVSEVGSYLQAGLPNITGNIYSFSGQALCSSTSSPNGAFYSVTTGAVYKKSNTAGTDTATVTLGFNASNYNSIYGNSTTVQPPSIVGMWLVKAYGVVEDTGSIDEQQYIDDRFAAAKDYIDDKIASAIAPIGTVVSQNFDDSTTLTVNTETSVGSIQLTAGTWVVTGHLRYATIIAGRQFVGVNTTRAVGANVDGTVVHYSDAAYNGTLSLCSTRIFVLSQPTTIYLNAFATVSCETSQNILSAVRII